MSEVVIVLRDYEDGSGKVKVASYPSHEDMCLMINAGHTPDQCHVYAMRALRGILEMSRENDPAKPNILIPRLT